MKKADEFAFKTAQTLFLMSGFFAASTLFAKLAMPSIQNNPATTAAICLFVSSFISGYLVMGRMAGLSELDRPAAYDIYTMIFAQIQVVTNILGLVTLNYI